MRRNCALGLRALDYCVASLGPASRILLSDRLHHTQPIGLFANIILITLLLVVTKGCGRYAADMRDQQPFPYNL